MVLKSEVTLYWKNSLQFKFKMTEMMAKMINLEAHFKKVKRTVMTIILLLRLRMFLVIILSQVDSLSD